MVEAGQAPVDGHGDWATLVAAMILAAALSTFGPRREAEDYLAHGR